MAGVGTTAVYRMAAVLIWGLAVWHSWLARGLFGDGSATLLYMMHIKSYVMLYDSRQTVIAVTQTPAALAIWLGITDTHLLARLLSAGLFGLPTAYYHACLFRARRDPALLAAVLLAIAVVFLPTSFFIIGEYNAILPAVLFVVLVLVTAERPTIVDGLLLIATAAMLLRSYETVLAFGLLLAGLVLWRLRQWRAPGWGARLYFVSALVLVAAAGFSLQSLIGPYRDESQIGDAVAGAALFWTNLQFVLPLVALFIVSAGGLLAPRLLQSRGLYLTAGILLALVALCPLLWLTGGEMRPLPKSHYHSRLVASLVMAAIVVGIWFYALRPAWTPKALALLSQAAPARRLMLFAFAALLAGLPADLQLTELWRQSASLFQATIAARPGLVPVEATPFGRRPWNDFVEDWALSSQSIVMRRSTRDGVILPPRGFAGWQFYDARKPWITDVDMFLWDGGRN
ncbi:MAG TPA: hypothetical protein VFB13_17210 [Reyranella sp.]|jgi:hypothetical protein|nr:hypothetical protein [Reyranella sp.]